MLYELPDDEFNFAPGLIEPISKLGNNLVGCEIGILYGNNLRYFLDHIPAIQKVYAIDPYLEYQDWCGMATQEALNHCRQEAMKLLDTVKHRIEFLYMVSDQAHVYIPDNSLDYIFIDGDHSYEFVSRDLANYYSKVKPQGIFAGHDYQLPGVFGALKDFRVNNDITNPILTANNNCWYWYK